MCVMNSLISSFVVELSVCFVINKNNLKTLSSYTFMWRYFPVWTQCSCLFNLLIARYIRKKR